MITRVPLTEFVQAEQGEAAGVVLVTITHDDLPEPLRFSSDNAVLFSQEPYLRGTRSKLIGTESLGGELAVAADFKYVLMSAEVPSDREAGAAAAKIVFDNVSREMVPTARLLKTPATVDFAVVLSTTPDYVDREWTELRSVGYSYDVLTLTLPVSREETLQHAWPYLAMTVSTCPGLHR